MNFDSTIFKKALTKTVLLIFLVNIIRIVMATYNRTSEGFITSYQHGVLSLKGTTYEFVIIENVIAFFVVLAFYYLYLLKVRKELNKK